MTLLRFNQHWRVLQQCEATGAKPRVYRELLEEITQLRAVLIEHELGTSCTVKKSPSI